MSFVFLSILMCVFVCVFVKFTAVGLQWHVTSKRSKSIFQNLNCISAGCFWRRRRRMHVLFCIGSRKRVEIPYGPSSCGLFQRERERERERKLKKKGTRESREVVQIKFGLVDERKNTLCFLCTWVYWILEIFRVKKAKKLERLTCQPTRIQVGFFVKVCRNFLDTKVVCQGAFLEYKARRRVYI